MSPVNQHHEKCSYPFARVLILVTTVMLLAACATTATHEGMTPSAFETATKHQRTVSVNIEGGKELDVLGRTGISDLELKQALIDSITKAQTFSQVIEGKGGDYLLTLAIFSVEQPVFGFSFTVKIETGWTLKRAASGETVWQEAIKSEHTATTGDAFVGATRLRLAVEGAARNNISLGLAKISRLSL